jgi:hypothetical protein
LQAVSKPVLVWHIPLLRVTVENSWWCTEELSETRGVSVQNKNFEKLVHLVGSIIINALNAYICTYGQTDKREDALATSIRKQAFNIQKKKVFDTLNVLYHLLWHSTL